MTLGELKDYLLDMPSLSEKADNLENMKFIRVREKTESGFFGKIFRDNSKTLKQLGISDQDALVIQLLDEAEDLNADDLVLTLSKRDSRKRIYTDSKQVKLVAATRINDILLKAVELFGKSDSTVNTIKLVKHLPEEFKWQVLNPDETFSYKQKKKKIKRRAGDMDLQKAPWLITDGAHIGVIVESSEFDDFQTETDLAASRVFNTDKKAGKKNGNNKNQSVSSTQQSNEMHQSVRIQFDANDD